MLGGRTNERWRAQYARSYTRKFVHSILLGAILLLAAGTNPTSLSIDNDGDDATPPITVELNFALPCNKAIHLHKVSCVTSAAAAVFEAHHPIAGLSHYSAHMPDAVSPPLIVPLRT
jgi:hypothetical protein